MTDSRLRELERRSKETGSVEDGAAYLLERVRTGALTAEQLSVAAYCGDPSARLALNEVPRSQPHDLASLGAGLAELGGASAVVFALVMVARHWLDLGEPTDATAEDQAAVSAALAWLAAPSPELERAAWTAAKRVGPTVPTWACAHAVGRTAQRGIELLRSAAAHLQDEAKAVEVVRDAVRNWALSRSTSAP